MGERGWRRFQVAYAPVAEQLFMRPLMARCYSGLATLYRQTGKQQQAREALLMATTMYREMDMRFWLERAEAGTMEPGA